MRRLPIVVIVAVSAALAGMGPASPESVTVAAAVPPPKAARPGEFVWHDLVTDKPATCRDFYKALLGWTFEPSEGVEPGYMIIRHKNRPIGGMVPRSPADSAAGDAQWLAYVVVADVDRTAEAFRQAGGRSYRGPLNARKDLRVAAVADPQGAALGLASRGPHFETTNTPELHEWLWMEYVARDPDSALQFYADVIGFRYEVGERRENFTYYLLSTDRPRAGLFQSIWERGSSAWLPYIRVEDPATMAARVTELGGTVLLPVRPSVRNSSLAIVADPSGAVIALQKFPFDPGATK